MTTSSGATSACVELRAIGKTFPGVRALHDVTLAIAPGEVLALVGENGAGKSTLIKILGGVYGAGSYAGDVIVGGQLARFKSTRDARTAGVAVVHQELALVPGMTVAENLLLGREPTRFGIVDRNRAEAMAKDMLAAVLGDEASAIDLATPVGHLGVGVQQILEIARALADRAKVIVLDEPTAALTDGEIARLFTLVRARKAQGTAFVYISHRLDEIATLCDRVAVMRDGELVGVRPAGVPTDELVGMMTGKELGDVHARKAHGATLGAPVPEVRNLRVAHPALPGRAVVTSPSFTVPPGRGVAPLRPGPTGPPAPSCRFAPWSGVRQWPAPARRRQGGEPGRRGPAADRVHQPRQTVDRAIPSRPPTRARARASSDRRATPAGSRRCACRSFA